MHLSVNAASTLLDLEGTTITLGFVPRVDAKLVVKAGIFIGSPTDDLDGVTTEGRSGLVVVNTKPVSEEVFIDLKAAVTVPYVWTSFLMLLTPRRP